MTLAHSYSVCTDLKTQTQI